MDSAANRSKYIPRIIDDVANIICNKYLIISDLDMGCIMTEKTNSPMGDHGYSIIYNGSNDKNCFLYNLVNYND